MDERQLLVRPAIVVSGEEYNRRTPDVLITLVTGNLETVPHPGDRRIGEWESAGLLKPSLAQTKPATVEASIIRRKIGRLDLKDLEDLSSFSLGLKRALAL